MAYIYDLSDTWNAGGTTFYGIKMNVTNSASAAGSKLLSLQVSGSEKFSVDPSGNVMVGSATPTFRLVVSRNTFDGAWADSLSTYSYFGLGGYFSGSAGSAQIGYERTTGAFIFGNGTRDTPTERMRIDSSGNVGIGATSGGERLYVSAGSGVQIGASDGTTTQRVGYCLAGVAYSGAASNHPYALLTNDTERMRIDTSGNVGIGTSAPARLFQVVAGSGAIPARIGNNLGNLDLGGSDGSVVNIDSRTWAMGLQTGGTERVRIKTTGQTRLVPLSADPSGAENGDMYYNSTTHKFRGYANGAWVDLH